MPIPIEGSIYDNDELIDTFGIASANECTGLVPAAVIDDSERKSYSQLYDIPLTKDTPPD